MTFQALLFLVCLSGAVAKNLTGYGNSQDVSSYSNVDDFRPFHLSFDMKILFDTQNVEGTVTHNLEVMNDDMLDLVWLDVTTGNNVSKAEVSMPDSSVEGCPKDFQEADFGIQKMNKLIGDALHVKLPCKLPKGEKLQLRMTFVTNPVNAALSWMKPSQTIGGKLPFMYSLCEMNYCRDWFPSMDTPSQKVTYDSRVVSPQNMVVKMSGNETLSGNNLDDDWKEWKYNCTIKVPSYLIAIVVGNLAEHKWDNRTSVMSEPEILDAAADDFEDLPTHLRKTEEYLDSPYIWGTYSIVFMPYSFPWGGMEHPLITFASPILITGEKSKVCL